MRTTRAPSRVSRSAASHDTAHDRTGDALQHGEVSTLVHRAQAGDRQAFGRLYERYAGLVRSIAATTLPVHETADAVQEVFLRALRNIRALRDARAFVGWLTAITRNTIRDFQRNATPWGVDQEQGSRETQIDEVEARTAIRAIRALPPAYRQTVRMRVLEGMTGPEIADRTGLTAASVRVNLHRGLKLLRERLTGGVHRRVPPPRG